MIIAAAQTRPENKSISQNLNDHYRLIELASKHSVQLIAFPEMSITGYVRETATQCALTESDSRLDKLRSLAVAHHIIVIAGAPVKMPSGLHIGSFIFFPNNTQAIYTKQHLHGTEADYFTPSLNYNPQIALENEKVSLAICADIDHPEHAKNACQRNSTIYIPSIFFSLRGIPEAYDNLSGYAKAFSLNVLMSNFTGIGWNNTESGGQSAFWNAEGQLLASLDKDSTGLVIAEKKDNIWRCKIIKE
jgi:predicted amidohydrolase